MISLRVDSWKVENIAFEIANYMKMGQENKEILGLLVGKLINAKIREEFCET